MYCYRLLQGLRADPRLRGDPDRLLHDDLHRSLAPLPQSPAEEAILAGVVRPVAADDVTRGAAGVGHRTAAPPVVAGQEAAAFPPGEGPQP